MKKKMIVAICLMVALIVGMCCLSGCANKNDNNAETDIQSSQTGEEATGNQEKEESTASSISSDLDSEDSVNQLHFRYSSADTLKESENGKRVENENYTAIVSYQEDKTADELAGSRGLTLVDTVTINGIDWKNYSYQDEQVSTIIYMYEKDNGTYVATFVKDAGSNVNIDNVIEDYMNAITFE